MNDLTDDIKKSEKTKNFKKSIFRFGGSIKKGFKNVGDKIGNTFEKKYKKKNSDIMQYEA